MLMLRTPLLPTAAALLIACAPPPAQTPQDVSREIEAANAEFVTAWSKGDAAAVAALYTADGQLLPPNGDVVTGPEAIQTFWQGAMDAGIASATLTTIEAMAVDSLAYEVGNYALVGPDGTPIDEGKYIVIWHRTPDGWRLYRDIWNTSRPPAE
jgi:uncharacterized protein (TIGR02246 family)